MTVSKIASEIYQAAKKAARAAWNWRTEWSKAMKKAWRKIMAKKTTKKSQVQNKTNRISGSCPNCKKYTLVVRSSHILLWEDGRENEACTIFGSAFSSCATCGMGFSSVSEDEYKALMA